MTTFKIPRPDELDATLTGVYSLLTARRWERAAIVFAYTAVGGPRNTKYHTPPPPKLNIRQFAAKGYAGLTTNKSVERYRLAWISAIDRGFAVPVEPGDIVTLPDMPFPDWPFKGGTKGRQRVTPEAGPGVLTDLSAADDALVRAIRRLHRTQAPLRPDLRDMVLSSLTDVDDHLRQLREMVDPAGAQVTRLRPV